MTVPQSIHEAIYQELLLEFTQNTTLPMDDSADTALRGFLGETIFRLLDENKIEWGGRARKFVRACAAGLARVAEDFAAAAGNASVITAATITLALKGNAQTPGLVLCWERVCPLPPVNGTGILVGCIKLREMLNM
ncbi:MAG: hypothetical protein ABI647_19315 [Gemmatimonadota bacterium]